MKFNLLTEEQINLLKDTTKTAIEISSELNCSTITVTRWRKKLSVSTPKGFKKGKNKPWLVSKKQILCTICKKQFSTNKASKQKYCSKKCMFNDEQYKLRLSKADKSYMKTEEYRKKLMRDDTPEYRRYRNRVTKLTELNYITNKDKINPNNFKRTLAGVDGGYHLDHKISCRYGFENNISEEIISSTENLQMLPWKENVLKGKK
jgi:hypothetical protein